MKILIKYIPNLITISRIIMTFLFIYTIEEQFVYGENLNIYLTMLFLVICLSDFVDGKIARKMDSVSIIGAKLDVFADLLYIILSYIILVTIKILPLWFLGFVCFKFTEFIITSNFIKRYSNSLDKPFVFDKIGRIVSAIFLIIPGIVCVYKCFEISNINFIFNCFIYIVFIAGLYSSYLRIKNCFNIVSVNNKNYIEK